MQKKVRESLVYIEQRSNILHNFTQQQLPFKGDSMEKDNKQYIEFLIYNEEHMQKIHSLEVLHWEIKLEGLDFQIYDRVNQLPQLIKEVKTLVESNYYYDPKIDVLGTIGKAWDNLILWENLFSPKMIAFAIEDEIEKRKKRKRKYSEMWIKLEELGLVEKLNENPSTLS